MRNPEDISPGPPQGSPRSFRFGVALVVALGAFVVLVASSCSSSVDAQSQVSLSSAKATGSAKHTIVAVGDIACPASGAVTGDSCRQAAVARRVTAISPAAVLLLGDIQYDVGALSDFRSSFGKSWGGLRRQWRPAPGNHEYATSGAAGYFKFFGRRAGAGTGGYYSYDVSGWHIVALNSNCDNVACGPGSAQGKWLKSDLAKNSRRCVAAYWHHPLFSSGEHGDNPQAKPLWTMLQDARADVVLNGHDHDYERFAPQDANGNADSANGIREFVVGTGGKSHYGVGTPVANSEFVAQDKFGALAMKLGRRGYSWRFVTVAGKTIDHGSALCH